MVWPGLNAPVIKGRELISIKPLPPDPERETKIKEARDRTSQFRTFKVPALQRGWTGGKLGGTSIGPPDPVGDCKEFSKIRIILLLEEDKTLFCHLEQG